MPPTSAHPTPSAADAISKTNGDSRSKQPPPQSMRLSDEAFDELTQFLELIQLVKRGNFTVRFPGSGHNLVNKIGRTLNEIIEINETLADELVRISSVAQGDLSQKMFLEIQGRAVKGEFYRIGTTVNAMVDQLNSFAAEVTRVAKEVGTEGKLGGQANVRGVSGVWKDLTDNVNFMAGNLTKQVRAIAEVSTAVTKGDLTRHIAVQAQGEVAALKDNINQMIANLRETTHKNQEQDWLKTHLAKFTEMMQGQRSIISVAQLIMSELTPLVGAFQGTFFMMEDEAAKGPLLRLVASYALSNHEDHACYRLKQGLVGQCAFEKKRILLASPRNYAPISSSLIKARPRNVIVLPVLFEGELKAVIELASFEPFSENILNFLNQLMDNIGVILNMIVVHPVKLDVFRPVIRESLTAHIGYVIPYSPRAT